MGSRSASIVPLRAGNRARRDRRREGRCREERAIDGKHGKGHEPYKPVHETAMDSRTGEEEAGNSADLAAPRHRPGMDAEGVQADRKDGASGIDGVTAEEYEAKLEANLRDLLDRIKSGRYRGTAGAQDVHPQGGRLATTARHPDLRGQGGAAGDRHGAGGGIRAGLSSVLAWLSSPAVGAWGVRVLFSAITWQRQLWVLDVDLRKYFIRSASPLASLPRPASDGRRHPTDDR